MAACSQWISGSSVPGAFGAVATEPVRVSAGCITIDGVELTTIDAEAWRQRLAGAFPDLLRVRGADTTDGRPRRPPRVDDRTAAGAAVDWAGTADVIDHLAYGLDNQLRPTYPTADEVAMPIHRPGPTTSRRRSLRTVGTELIGGAVRYLRVTRVGCTCRI